MRTRSWLRLAGVAVMVAAGLSSGVGVASPIKPGIQWTVAPPGAPLVSPLNQVANEIAERGLTQGVDTYSGMELDRAAGKVIVYATDQAKGRALVGASGHGKVDVEVRSAKYTRAQLRAAQNDFWKTAGPEVYSIAGRPDGSGLVVRTEQGSTASLRKGVLGGAVSTVDVTVEPGVPIVPSSRYDDVPPFAGGTHIASGGASFCSSSYVVSQFGRTFLMTAGHCFPGGVGSGPVTTGGGGHYIGTVSGFATINDAASVGTNAWSGVWTNNDHWTHYRDNAWSFNGDEVCQSGVATNYTCGIWVTDSFLSWRLSGLGWIVEGVEACAPPGFVAARPGDSGGPVYNWHGDGKLQSRGMISARGGRCMYFTQTRELLLDWSRNTSPVTQVVRP